MLVRSSWLVLALFPAACRGEAARPAPAPVAHADDRCAPYLEATGAEMFLAPQASVWFDDGVRLTIVSAADDLELAPPGLEVYRASGDVHAWYAREVDLGGGVTARAGATTLLRAVAPGDRFEVLGAGVARIVRCDDLAAARPPPPPPWRPARPVRVTADTSLDDDGEDPLACLDEGAVVDLVAVEGERARATFVVADHVVTGWIATAALDLPDSPGGLVGGCAGELHGGFGFGTASECPAAEPAILPVGVSLATDLVLREGTRVLPAFDRDVPVTLVHCTADWGLVEVDAPAPGVARLRAWARRAELTAPGA